MVLSRTDAEDPAQAAAVRAARFVYLGGGSALHLRSVLKQSAVWRALEEAWRDGAVIAGSGAGAMVLGDPMWIRGAVRSPRARADRALAVLPGASGWSPERCAAPCSLTSGGRALVAVDERTAIIRSSEGRCRSRASARPRCTSAGWWPDSSPCAEAGLS